MIVLFGGEKGGTGKTTLAVNVAGLRTLTGRDVLLVDADAQGSAAAWAATRDETKPLYRVPCVQLFGDIRRDVEDLAGRYQDIIIDAGGRDSAELRSALVVADRAYTPLKPSQFDVWSLERMDGLVGQARAINAELAAFVVINQANPNPRVKEATEAQDFVSELENLELAETIIRDRVAFRHAIREGLAVPEAKGTDAKSRAEIMQLYQEVFGHE